MRGLIIFSLIFCVIKGEFPLPSYEGVVDAIENPKYREILSKMFPNIKNETKGRNGRIVGGDLAELGQFPFQVLLYMSPDGNRWYTCGGSLIKRNFVLTAAHCVEDNNQFEVYVGLIKRPPGYYYWRTIFFGRSNVFVHPERNKEDFSYDVALIKIEDAPENLLTSDYVDVVKIPLSDQKDVSLVGELGTISGFGRTNDSALSISPDLRYALAPIMENSVCAEDFGPFIRNNNLCINTEERGTGSCSGDSGGPLTVSTAFGEGPVIAGIVSFGAASSCTSGYPSVFARVTHFVDWINSIIDPPPPDNSSCNCVCNCFTCQAPPDSTTDFWRK